MENNEINEKIKSLEHRIEKLKQRIELQKLGPEVDTARKILSGLEEKYEDLKKNSCVFIAEATSSKKSGNFSEDELIKKLGAVYWIFGSSYEEMVSYKRYRIEFVQISPNVEMHKELGFAKGCLMTVQVHIYENDRPFIMENASIEFWKGWTDSTEVDYINLASNDTNIKYQNSHWFEPIEYNLVKTWNKYFQTVPLLEAKESGLLEAKW